jgi:hypothetical protein
MAKFSLLAKIGLDSKAFQTGLNTAKSSVGKFSKSVVNASNRLAKMGLASAAAGFLLLSRRAIQLGSELSDVAANTGFATEEFQVFRGAMIDAGGSAKSMEKAIVIMQKAVVQGSEGLTTYVRAFERIGLNVDDLRKMRPEQQFEEIGKAIAGAKDQQGALTAALEIFGQKNAGRLIEVFKRLDKEGYGKMAEDIRKAYGIMDAETQAALDKAADTIERFKNKATIYVGELIAGEADGAALKKLGFRIMEAGANLGVSMVTGIAEAVAFARNGFGAFSDFFYDKLGSTIGLIGTLLKITLAESINPMLEKLNKIPKINIDLIDTDKLNDDLTKDLDKGSKAFSEYFDARQAKQKEFELGYDPAKFWKEAAQAEESKLETSRKAAKEARDAAKASLEALNGGGGSGGSGGSGGEEDKKEKLKGLEKDINDMKLKALRAQANGDKEAQAAMERRAKLAQRILDIMKKFNVSQEEATLLANKTAEGGDITGEIEKRSSLSGRELKAASDLAGKGKGENGEDIRFDRLAGGGFQQFVGGKKGKKFSEAEMQAGLQKQINKDPSEALLEKINQTLEGKFVSQ